MEEKKTDAQVQPEQRTYTQAQVDDIVAAAKANLHSKYEKTHIARTEFETLQGELNKFKRADRERLIQDAYNASGGNPNYFNDFLKLNQDLYETKEDVDMSKRLDQFAWAKLPTNPNDFLANYESKQETNIQTGLENVLYWKGDK